MLRFHFLSCRRRERAAQRKREGGGSSCSEENERGGLATFKRPSSRVFFIIIRILTRCFVFSSFSRFRRWSVLFIWRGSMFRCFLRMRCSDVAFLYLGYLQQCRDISFAIIFPATTKKSFCLCHTPEMDIQIRATPPRVAKQCVGSR